VGSVSLSCATHRTARQRHPFNGISHVQRSDGWIETTWNNMSNPGAFAMAGAEEQKGDEPPPVGGAGVFAATP
jgi:hypothetical protein